MDFYGVNMTGPFVVQKVTEVPSRFEVIKDRGRLIRIERTGITDEFYVGIGKSDNLTTANVGDGWWRKITLGEIDPNILFSEVRVREVYTYSGSTTTSPVDVTIPNTKTYNVGEGSLEVYLNRVRLLPSEFTEIDETTVRFPTGLVNGDVIEFYEKFGYIDVSETNFNLITTLTDNFHVEHNTDGTHKELVVPTGSIITMSVDSVPSGYLHCNGSSVSTTTYADLFSVIGYKYGGTGSLFKLPDYRGYFLRGWASTSSVDPDKNSRLNRGDGTTGNNVGTKQEDLIEDHSHSLDNVWKPGGGGPEDGNNSSTIDSTGLVNTPDVAGDETRPKNIYVMYCIKY